jgi:DNA-binding NtrC family response regulator
MIVDDDKNLLEVKKYNLPNDGYLVVLAKNGTSYLP